MIRFAPSAGKALACVLALLLAFLPAAAEAKPPAGSAKIDKEIYGITARAEGLLNDLEYERAREMLEESVRNSRYRTGSPKAKGKLWALLGRARAELGNTMGMEEAFLEAVRWNRRVRLSKSTSPKILDALERARANAPVPGDEVAVAPPPEEPPPRKEPPAKEPPAKQTAKEPPAKQTAKEPPKQTSKEPPAKQTSKEPPPKQTSKEPPSKQTSKEPPAQTASKEPPAQTASKEPPAKQTSKEPPPKEPPAKQTSKEPPPKEPPAKQTSKEPPPKEPSNQTASKEPPPKEPPAKQTSKEPPPKEPSNQTASKEPPAKEPPLKQTASKEPPPKQTASKEPPAKHTAKEPAKQKEPPRPKGPWIEHEVRGTVAVGESVTLVVKHGNLPKGSKIEALVKRTQTGAFKAVPLVASGTVARAKIQIDRPKIDLYVRAVKAKKVVAQIGSELEPIVLSTTPPPPPLAQAWSETPPVSTATVSTSTTARLGETIVAPPPPAVAGGGLSDLEIGLIAGGAGLIVVTVVVVVVVLATRKSNCDVEEGFGCVEVQVLPLMRF